MATPAYFMIERQSCLSQLNWKVYTFITDVSGHTVNTVLRFNTKIDYDRFTVSFS